MASGGLFRKLRIILLLFVLFIVGADTYLTKIRSTDWDQPLIAVVYPINADGSDVSDDYIQQLSGTSFAAIEKFFKDEAGAFGLALAEPVEVRLAPPLNELPPKAPADKSPLKTMWWSLKMRYWSATVEDQYTGPPPNIKMYVLYFDPDNTKRLDHSLGLEKGLIGVVNAFSAERLQEKNNVVIAHELLHTVGATDKYEPGTGHPLFPHGYAEPDKDPLYPQDFAEIMGGVVALSESEHKMPENLDRCMIGRKTATEINWVNEI
jgi:hypothetical protein